MGNFSGESETETRFGDLHCRSQSWWTDEVFVGKYTMKEAVQNTAQRFSVVHFAECLEMFL